jgi:hypothetical protein
MPEVAKGANDSAEDGGGSQSKRRENETENKYVSQDLLADQRCAEAVMAFLGSTNVGMWPDRT